MRQKLGSQRGMTLTEMLCAVIIVLLFSGLVAVGTSASVRSFRTSMAESQAQELCSTLTAAISDKLRYCGSVKAEGNQIFIQDIGNVSGDGGSIFQVDEESGQLYLGQKQFLSAAAYPEGLRVDAFQMRYDGNGGIFSVSFQIVGQDGVVLAPAVFQVQRINFTASAAGAS